MDCSLLDLLSTLEEVLQETVLDLGYVATTTLAIVSEEILPTQYWKHPGAVAGAGLVKNINTDRFLGILSVLVQAAFSFQGMELVAM